MEDRSLVRVEDHPLVPFDWAPFLEDGPPLPTETLSADAEPGMEDEFSFAGPVPFRRLGALIFSLGVYGVLFTGLWCAVEMPSTVTNPFASVLLALVGYLGMPLWLPFGTVLSLVLRDRAPLLLVVRFMCSSPPAYRYVLCIAVMVIGAVMWGFGRATGLRLRNSFLAWLQVYVLAGHVVPILMMVFFFIWSLVS